MITASRLGSAPLTVDWSALTAVTTAAREATPEATIDAWKRLRPQFSDGSVGFYDTPVNNDYSEYAQSKVLADALLKKEQFTDCLVLGIGGSALGPISVLSALSFRAKSGMRFHFMENPDPIEWKQTLARLKPERTLVVAITKSGGTFETMAQFLLALQWLREPGSPANDGANRWKTQVVAITDPVKGDLKTFATRESIPTLHIAPSIGGRFSVFSPVGLFPMALAGLDAQEFLAGAKLVREHCEKAPPEKNPLFTLAGELLRHSSARSVHVCMPYSTQLRSFSSWFVQLWGESLGKDGKGFTPVAAVGATDQHSILQLLRDGPDDKVTMFLTIDQVEDEVPIPSLSRDGRSGTALPAFKILEGHSLQELLNIEYRATSLVLTRRGRPSVTFRLDRLDERSLGALYFAYAVLTSFLGTRMGVNPFDQPGVEEGKVYIREALSQTPKPGAEDDENSPVSRLRREPT